jgi:GTP-binding protein Era
MTKANQTDQEQNNLKTESKCGYVAVVGRPNVGKSTLLNHLLQQKICITSRKPQTTRHQQLGIKTEDNTQIIFVDTPGIHNSKKRFLNQYMNQEARSALYDVDLVIFVVESIKWQEEDDLVAKLLKDISCPVIIALNKIDRKKNKHELMPFIASLSERLSFAELVPISALQNDNLETLNKVIVENLPEAEHIFSEDEITDRSSRFLCAEIVREKIIRQLGDELPYELTVEIESFEDKGNIIHMDALILVDRDSQKQIVIGEQGKRLKSIGSQAREDIELLLDTKIMLKTWVKVKSGWADSERALKSLNQFKEPGFGEK